MTARFTSGFGRYAFGPGRLAVDLIEQSVSTLLGRDLDITFGDARARMIVQAIHLWPTPTGMVTGSMDAVDIELDAVTWDDGHIDEMTLHAKSVRVTPGLHPELVARPVHVEARLSQATFDDWLRRAGVEWRVRLARPGVLEVSWPGRETWGHAVFTPTVRDGRLRLAAEEVVVGGRRVRSMVQRYAPPLDADIPVLPADARVTGIEPLAEWIHVRAVIDEIREPITPAQLWQMRKAIGSLTGTDLVLPRL